VYARFHLGVVSNLRLQSLAKIYFQQDVEDVLIGRKYDVHTLNRQPGKKFDLLQRYANLLPSRDLRVIRVKFIQFVICLNSVRTKNSCVFLLNCAATGSKLLLLSACFSSGFAYMC